MIRAELAAEFRRTPIGRLLLALDDVAEGQAVTGTGSDIAALCRYLRDALLDERAVPRLTARRPGRTTA